MKTLKRILAASLLAGLFIVITSPAFAQPVPRDNARYIRDITGTNTVIPAAKTFTNITGTALAAWKFDGLSIWATAKADGTSSNAVIVFRRVLNEGDAPPRLLTPDNHFNLVLVPDGVAGQLVTMPTNFPTSVTIADCWWQAWMITNGGCNWTNVSIQEVGRAKQRN